MLMMDDDSIIGKTTKRCRFAADEKKDVDDLVKEGRSVVEISMQMKHTRQHWKEVS